MSELSQSFIRFKAENTNSLILKLKFSGRTLHLFFLPFPASFRIPYKPDTDQVSNF
ncbi:hypothetical protein LEP1GSC016_2188 [Leptospira borgpetersenii serovar Hardjo-bovis str. Sponselee]|uniref:Uncharacterized protein n=1 Tax=Leptospira borgpetersenii serovar Hardjo-bovis str. Sponselee TaxID=1303729 RepID=M6BQM6_LEPBO|nr:hypothetical protein LEP1GSC016_2188 [Leptospira borgpetersenii serovar Hardjo-bovis str. Sponselee]